MKTRIIEYLGQSDIVLPALVRDALAANDRAKVRMSALQAASNHARLPGSSPLDLSQECESAGMDAAAIRAFIGASRPISADVVSAPGVGRMGAALLKDVRIMVQAVEAGDPAAGEAAAERLAVLSSQAETINDEITLTQISRLTALPKTGDSVHRLVMDLHKSLNKLTTQCSEEVVAGASAHGLEPDDRPLVEAFMRGVDSTRALKFDHPGLDATAGRSGTRLIIQNDIGTTDAHVLVAAVEGRTVTVTYSDVHQIRARFFVGLFDKFAIQWSGLDRKTEKGLAEDGAFYLITGRYDAPRLEDRMAFLESIGAGLVFLIDWNKARKALRNLVTKQDAVRILNWAARNRIGHRAFLELGGAGLVASAIRSAAPTRIGYGELLETVLGREASIEFLQSVLSISTRALLEGRSIRLARDAIEAELAHCLERTDRTLLAVVVRQAGLGREIAARIAQHVSSSRRGALPVGRERADELAKRARRIEEKADRIAIEARDVAARLDVSSELGQMVNRVEEAIDELEQAAFIASLLPSDLRPGLVKPLVRLCAAAVGCAEATAQGVDAASELPDGRRVDSDDALAAAARLIDLEHEADDAERTATAIVLRASGDFQQDRVGLELARALERCTDRFAAAGHLLREHVMLELAA
jgi:hypothetical protein